MSYRFHAATLPGEWINDPNGLDFHDGRYRLHVQHAADAPSFKRVGWGRFTSPDLLDWSWDGVAIPPDKAGSAYSGSIVTGEGQVEAFLTRHRADADPRQVQVRRGLTGDAVDSTPLGPAGRNCRDPFVFRRPATGDRRMLMAEPCDWEGWTDADRSRLGVWRSDDGRTWARAGSIGPWRSPGVMWQVPALIDFGDAQVLIVSEVDRRSGARCSVRYWPGRFDGSGFEVEGGTPPAGHPLDLGPDFYAAIPNLAEGWPGGERVVVAWASSWATARAFDWPEKRGGGPIALPRTLTWDARAGRLRQRPVAAAERFRHWIGRPSGDPFAVTIRRGAATLTATVGGGEIEVRRGGDPSLDWSATHSLPPPTDDDAVIELYADGPLMELFLARHGVALTAVLPGEGDPIAHLD